MRVITDIWVFPLRAEYEQVNRTLAGIKEKMADHNGDELRRCGQLVGKPRRLARTEGAGGASSSTDGARPRALWAWYLYMAHWQVV